MFHSTGHAQHTKCKTTFDSVALRASKHGSVINTSQLLIFETGNAPPNYRMPLSPSALLRLKKLHTSPYYPVSPVFKQYYSVLQIPSLFNAEDRRYTVLLSRSNWFFLHTLPYNSYLLLDMCFTRWTFLSPLNKITIYHEVPRSTALYRLGQWVSHMECSSGSSRQNTASKSFAEIQSTNTSILQVFFLQVEYLKLCLK